MQMQFSSNQMEKQQMFVYSKADIRVKEQLEAIIDVAKVLCCKDLFASLLVIMSFSSCWCLCDRIGWLLDQSLPASYRICLGMSDVSARINTPSKREFQNYLSASPKLRKYHGIFSNLRVNDTVNSPNSFCLFTPVIGCSMAFQSYPRVGQDAKAAPNLFALFVFHAFTFSSK